MTTKTIDRPTTRTVTRPPLVVSAGDYERLAALATAVLDSSPQVANELLDEIERATIVAEADRPADVIGMGSTVVFREDASGKIQRVRLVYPQDADIEAGRVSVLTPVGAALIGLTTGQTIAWQTRTGERRTLTVLEVAPPAAA